MPPRVPHGQHGWEDHSLSVLPVIGNFLVLFLILAGEPDAEDAAE